MKKDQNSNCSVMVEKLEEVYTKENAHFLILKCVLLKEINITFQSSAKNFAS